MLQNGSTRKKRARMRVCVSFLSNAPYGLKRIQKKFGMIKSILKFLRARKRADERARAHLRTLIDLKLTGRILILIVIIMNEKLLFRYEDMIIS